MVLGTLLGDGCVATRARYATPNYFSRHGYCQHAYNKAKYQILSAFAPTPPKKVKNFGYGEWSSFWQTRTLRQLLPIQVMCYPGGTKTVTAEWLRQLTWEAIAWWYQDDGSLAVRSQLARFHTEGLDKRSVYLLAGWLRRHGVAAKVYTHHRKGKLAPYHVIHLSVRGTQVLVENIRQYVVPSMRYKIKLRSWKAVLVCHWCKRKFAPSKARRIVRHRPCCGSKECESARHDHNNEKYMNKPGVRAARNAKARETWYSDVEKNRARAKVTSAAWRARNPDKVKATKKKILAKVQAARATRPWTCRRCGLTEPQGTKDSRVKYCPTCRKHVTDEIKRRSALKHPRSSR